MAAPCAAPPLAPWYERPRRTRYHPGDRLRIGAIVCAVDLGLDQQEHLLCSWNAPDGRETWVVWIVARDGEMTGGEYFHRKNDLDMPVVRAFAFWRLRLAGRGDR